MSPPWARNPRHSRADCDGYRPFCACWTSLPSAKGLLGITLRYPYEVRKEEDYFDDIPDEKIPKE
jgi:hypothetical protein